jgi:hypothetical protein
MIEALAFALVAVALGFPALIVALLEVAPPGHTDIEHGFRRALPGHRLPRPVLA